MKRPIVTIAIVLALIAGATSIGLLYFGLNPVAWREFVAELQGEAPSSVAPRTVTQPLTRPDRSGQLAASGSIEAEEVTIAAEIGGRIVELAVREGDKVARGQVLVRLAQTTALDGRRQAEAGVAQARAALAAVQAQLAMARAGARTEEVAMAESDLAATEAAVVAAAVQPSAATAGREAAVAGVSVAEGQLQRAEAGHALAEAQVAAAQAALLRANRGATQDEIAIAQRGVERAKNMRWAAQTQRDEICGQPGQSTGEAMCDNAQAMVQVAEEDARIAELQLAQLQRGARAEDIAALEAQVAQAQAGVDAAQGDIVSATAAVAASEATLAVARAGEPGAQANLDVARAQRDRAQSGLSLIEAGARSEEIASAVAQVQVAEATLSGAQAALESADTQLERTTLASPIGGLVVHSLVHEGELASPAAPLLKVADLKQVTLTVYIPEAELGKVALGQSVQVTVDSYEDVFEGSVSHIASQAEFTPKNIQTQTERVHMVFAIKVTLNNADLRLKPGMPADAVFQ